MKTRTAIGGLAALAGGAWLAREARSDGGREPGIDRWLVVTVNRPPQEITAEGRIPGPLGELADHIELQVRPAPGDKGTEIAARMRGPVPENATGPVARLKGDHPSQELRLALRGTKSILECGEIVQPDPWDTTKPTAAGKLFDAVAVSRARGEGRL